MKVRILMATLAVSLLVSIQGFANPCDSACVDPCAACNRNVAGCDLFSGLKRLVNGVHVNSCDPCDAVVACNLGSDFAACNPCDDVACNSSHCGLGGRLRGLFASPSCTPCDFTNDCGPCDNRFNCDPCGCDGCNTGCGPRFTLRSLNPFKGLNFRGCNSDCGPCDMAGNGKNCGPCDCLGRNCGMCDNSALCNPCDDVCGDAYCGPRGHLLDLPRVSLKKLFGGLRTFGCNDRDFCNPCDNVCPRPCDDACYR